MSKCRAARYLTAAATLLVLAAGGCGAPGEGQATGSANASLSSNPNAPQSPGAGAGRTSTAMPSDAEIEIKVKKNLDQLDQQLAKQSSDEQRKTLAQAGCTLDQTFKNKSVPEKFYRGFYGGLAQRFNQRFNSLDPNSGNSSALTSEEQKYCPGVPGIG